MGLWVSYARVCRPCATLGHTWQAQLKSEESKAATDRAAAATARATATALQRENDILQQKVDEADFIAKNLELTEDEAKGCVDSIFKSEEVMDFLRSRPDMLEFYTDQVKALLHAAKGTPTGMRWSFR